MLKTYEEYIYLIKNDSELTRDEYNEFILICNKKLDDLLIKNKNVLERLKNF